MVVRQFLPRNGIWDAGQGASGYYHSVGRSHSLPDTDSTMENFLAKGIPDCSVRVLSCWWRLLGTCGDVPTFMAEAYWAAAQANTTGRFMSPMEGHGGTLLLLPAQSCCWVSFPWSAFLPSVLYQSLKKWKTYWNGQSFASSRIQSRIFPQYVGCGFVDLLYSLGYAIATLYISAVSGIGYLGGPMVETISRPIIIL